LQHTRTPPFLQLPQRRASPAANLNIPWPHCVTLSWRRINLDERTHLPPYYHTLRLELARTPRTRGAVPVSGHAHAGVWQPASSHRAPFAALALNARRRLPTTLKPLQLCCHTPAEGFDAVSPFSPSDVPAARRRRHPRRTDYAAGDNACRDHCARVPPHCLCCLPPLASHA